jgi:Tfp pilus assembly protein PilX
MMKEWKDPLDDQKVLVKNYKDSVERLTGEKRDAKTALDEAEAALVGDENNQEKIDTKNAA